MTRKNIGDRCKTCEHGQFCAPTASLSSRRRLIFRGLKSVGGIGCNWTCPFQMARSLVSFYIHGALIRALALTNCDQTLFRHGLLGCQTNFLILGPRITQIPLGEPSFISQNELWHAAVLFWKKSNRLTWVARLGPSWGQCVSSNTVQHDFVVHFQRVSPHRWARSLRQSTRRTFCDE